MSRSASNIHASMSRPTRLSDTGKSHHGPILARPRLSHAPLVNDDTLLNDDPLEHEQPASASDGEDDYTFFWENEQALLSDLMEEGPGESEEDRLDMLADRAAAPFLQKRQELKEQLARTFVPAMQRVILLHRALDERADVSYGKGLVLYNNACKDLEAATLSEYEDLVKAYENTRVNIASLMEQLKAEYDHRDRLWLNLEQKINETVELAISQIQETPAQVERTIVKLEKHWQSLDKEKASGVVSEKRIKELISKLA